MFCFVICVSELICNSVGGQGPVGAGRCRHDCGSLEVEPGTPRPTPRARRRVPGLAAGGRGAGVVGPPPAAGPLRPRARRAAGRARPGPPPRPRARRPAPPAAGPRPPGECESRCERAACHGLLSSLLHSLSSRAIGVKRKSSCSLHLLILAERVAGSRLHVIVKLSKHSLSLTVTHQRAARPTDSALSPSLLPSSGRRPPGPTQPPLPPHI